MKNRTITKTDVDKFVSKLDDSMRRIYRDIYSDLISCEDTLDDEFQILVLLDEVFWDYVEKKKEEGLIE